jgi:CheY-like chemotaxis protein
VGGDAEEGDEQAGRVVRHDRDALAEADAERVEPGRLGPRQRGEPGVAQVAERRGRLLRLVEHAHPLAVDLLGAVEEVDHREGDEHVLIVEDDRDIANLMAELLELAGFSVVVASDAAFGLAALRTRQFALVLSDHRMPGQTGVDMLREARAEGLLDGVAALIVSADELEDTPWRALRKPVLFDELLAEMRRAIDERAAGCPRPRLTPARSTRASRPRRARGSRAVRPRPPSSVVAASSADPT